jgi:hypothetical protein
LGGLSRYWGGGAREAMSQKRAERSFGGALRRVRGEGVSKGETGRAVVGSPRQRRRRRKVGKRSNPRYKLAPGYVREEVHETVMRALGDRSLRAEILAELDEYGVEHRPGRADYGDLVELLLRRWLEEKSVEVGEA